MRGAHGRLCNPALSRPGGTLMLSLAISTLFAVTGAVSVLTIAHTLRGAVTAWRALHDERDF